MNKLFSLPLLAVAAVLAFAPAQAATLEGQRFDDTARLGSRDLQLNGLGVRAIYIFKAFVAGLYLTEKVVAGPEALSQSGPKRLQLRMLMEVGSDHVKQALVDGMRKNVTDAEWAAMQERVQRFSRTIDSIGVAREGDTITLDYVPEQGLLLAVNEVPRGTAIGGADFYQALLEIFVGPDPVDTRLKNGLLGQ
ncbi:MAG: chalcone isomerase family protein [Burkholderiales bacterium]|nr:chalcone isomerase family protein [Burkholderiales bacterium]